MAAACWLVSGVPSLLRGETCTTTLGKPFVCCIGPLSTTPLSSPACVPVLPEPQPPSACLALSVPCLLPPHLPATLPSAARYLSAPSNPILVLCLTCVIKRFPSGPILQPLMGQLTSNLSSTKQAIDNTMQLCEVLARVLLLIGRGLVGCGAEAALSTGAACCTAHEGAG